MFGKLELASGQRSRGPRHWAACVCSQHGSSMRQSGSQCAFVPGPQSHSISCTIAYWLPPALFHAGGTHTAAGTQGGQITGGHLGGCHHNRGRPDFGEPVIKSYHSKSHLVCVLHPSNVRRPSACKSNHPPFLLSDEKSNYNTMWKCSLWYH